MDIVYLSQYEESAVEPDAWNSRNDLGIASPLEFNQQLSIDLLDFCLKILRDSSGKRTIRVKPERRQI
jgi:hypothetical protein